LAIFVLLTDALGQAAAAYNGSFERYCTPVGL